MKAIIVILALTACVAGQSWRVKERKSPQDIKRECRQQHPFTAEQWNKLKKGQIPDEKEVRDFLLCLVMKQGIFQTGQNFDIDRTARAFQRHLGTGNATELVQACVNQHKTDNKEDAVFVYEVHDCLHKIVENDWFVKTAEQRVQINIECLKDHPLSKDQLKHVRNNIIPDEKAVHEFVLCKALKHGIFSPSEGFHIVRIVKQFNPGMEEGKATKIVNECVNNINNKNYNDEALLVYKVYTCLMKMAADFQESRIAAEDWDVKTLEQRQQINIECLKEHPLSQNQLQNIKSNVFPDEKAVREFLLCKALKHGIFSHSAGFYINRIVKQFNPGKDEGKATEYVNECVNNIDNRDDKKDDVVVFEAFACLQNNPFFKYKTALQ